MLRTEPTAEDSFALILARSRFGMAIAAMIRMIATTISNSINEKPFCLRIHFSSSRFLKPEFESVSNLGLGDQTQTNQQLACQSERFLKSVFSRLGFIEESSS